ncbi:MAG: glycosyl hydrolase 115 family protein [Clostridia bacterium]|nr:glycosyl hydrolase 115 family protein [Clostridia bacterium]
MSFLFHENDCKKIYVAKDSAESVLLAIEDFIKDVRAVCGDITFTNEPSIADIVVCAKDSEEFFALTDGGVYFSHTEEFVYQIKDGKIFFFGADDLGVLWALYTFMEKELGVPPYYYFDGIQIERKQALLLEEKCVRDYPHTRFRGWFVNDEDLLSGFMNKGERKIDYFFYKKVIDPILMEKIVETALRFRVNLLIPSTLVDIENPAEAALLDVAAKRGMYVSQHHIEPLGVSHYGMRAFLKAHGYDSENISFITNRAGMEAAWRHYAEKWAKYPRVVWQLGLRGNSDIPVWVSDKNVGSTDAERGKLISDAIFTQYNIIKEVVKGDIYTSMTVWMESANLLAKGALILPKDTFVVFADIGASQMYGEDFFSVPRETGREYGVYYHAGYWNVGPHLAEGVIPQKMDYCYALARETNADGYSVLNVANVKEFTFSIFINSSLTWYGPKANLQSIIREYTRYYSEDAEGLYEAINKYFASFVDMGETWYAEWCGRNNFHYHQYEGLPFPPFALNDGWLCWFIKRPFEDKVKFFDAAVGEGLSAALTSMEQAKKRLGETAVRNGAKEAFRRQWLYQAAYWTKLIKAGLSVFLAVKEAWLGDRSDLSALYMDAATELEGILDLRKEVYLGEWKNWFAFEKKLDIAGMCTLLKEMADDFRRETKD